jgi:hypothetical protein
MSDGWRENSNGNWVLIDGGELEATVYETDLGWGGVWNGAVDSKPRRLKGKHPTADEAMATAEAAIAEGPNSMKWWPPDDKWQTTIKGDGYYRKHNGQLISVKKAKSGSSFATNGSSSLGHHGRTAWFPAAEEARAAVDAFASGAGEWHWVSWSDAA